MSASNVQGHSSGSPPEFLNLERRLEDLNDQYQRGGLSDQAYQAAVQSLTVNDASGSTWWLGGEHGAWHRWDGVRWIREDPPTEAPTPVPAQTSPKRNWRPMLLGCGAGVLVVAFVAGVLLIGGWREYAQMPKIVEGVEPGSTGGGHYAVTAEQLDVVRELGSPQAFTLLFYEEELLDGTFGDVRFETWDYYEQDVSYTFINGELVGEEFLEVEIVGDLYPIPYMPDQFTAYMSLDEVLASAGLDRYLVVPLEKELVDGGEVYYVSELTFGLKDNELLYIEALGLEVTE